MLNWPNYLRLSWTQKTVKTEEARQECRVWLIKTSIAVLTVHAETGQLYTFQQSMQDNRNINLW